MANLFDRMRNNMSPTARKAARAAEYNIGFGSQVVQNEYEKAVATGRYAGSMDEFAKMRGMKFRK